MVETAKTSPIGGLGEMYMSAAAVYPAALRAGITFWSEVGSAMVSYYANALDGTVRAVTRPGEAPSIVSGLSQRFRQGIESYAELIERVILTFNESVERARRQSADAAPSGGRGARSADDPTDLASLRERLERALEQLRAIETRTSPGTRRETASFKIDV